MNVALDAQGNRLYAEDEEKYSECFCPACGEPLKHKKGKVRRPYFAHLPDTKCHYGQDKDYKSEWHIRMQEYFPKEEREYLFVDEETGEKHIADVFVKDENTVLEFQHSPIDEQEFISRTHFHLKNNRRIVWLFDESSSSKEPNYGRFKTTYEEPIGMSANDILNYPYQVRTFKWLRNPRRMLSAVPNRFLYSSYFCVCVFTGTEGDVFHRIIKQEYHFEEVVFSIHEIEMNEGMNTDDFFKPEDFWQNEEPWKEEFEWRRKKYQEIMDACSAKMIQTTNISLNSFQRYPRRRWRF